MLSLEGEIHDWLGWERGISGTLSLISHCWPRRRDCWGDHALEGAASSGQAQALVVAARYCISARLHSCPSMEAPHGPAQGSTGSWRYSQIKKQNPTGHNTQVTQPLTRLRAAACLPCTEGSICCVPLPQKQQSCFAACEVGLAQPLRRETAEILGQVLWCHQQGCEVLLPTLAMASCSAPSLKASTPGPGQLPPTQKEPSQTSAALKQWLSS